MLFLLRENVAVSILPIISLRRIFIPRGASFRRDCERHYCSGLLHRGYTGIGAEVCKRERFGAVK